METALLENLIVKFPAFYETRSSISPFARTRRCPMFWDRWIWYIPCFLIRLGLPCVSSVYIRVVQQKHARGRLHIYRGRPNGVTARIQTCVALIHQAPDAFLEEFRRLLLEKVADSLFNLSVRLGSASLECLPQWPKDVEVAGGENLIVRRMLQYLRTHELHLGSEGVRHVRACIIVPEDDSGSQISAHKHCHTRPASADESALVDSSLRPKTESHMLMLLRRIWTVIRHTFRSATRHSVEQSR
jgi:hypothetical protein